MSKTEQPIDYPEGAITRKVRMSETLFQQLGADRVDWGEPDSEGFYTPTVYSKPAATPTPTTEEPNSITETPEDHR